MEFIKNLLGDKLNEYYSKCESTGSEFNPYICGELIFDMLTAYNLLDNKTVSLLEIKECIDDGFGADCSYYNIDAFEIAKHIYDKGFRLCRENKIKELYNYEN